MWKIWAVRGRSIHPSAPHLSDAATAQARARTRRPAMLRQWTHDALPPGRHGELVSRSNVRGGTGWAQRVYQTGPAGSGSRMTTAPHLDHEDPLAGERHEKRAGCSSQLVHKRWLLARKQMAVSDHSGETDGTERQTRRQKLGRATHKLREEAQIVRPRVVELDAGEAEVQQLRRQALRADQKCVG